MGFGLEERFEGDGTQRSFFDLRKKVVKNNVS
jgi:hypothetical protein